MQPTLTAAVDVSELTWRAAALVISLFQPLFWAMLGVGFVLASVHLVSMLATRWGDRRASGKALAFSAAIHVSTLVGMLALLPDYRPSWLLAAEEPEEERIEVRTSLDRDELASQTTEAGNTPVWEKLQQSPDGTMSRLTPTPEQIEEPTIAQRIDATAQSPIELPRDMPLPDVVRDIPQALASNNAGATTPATVPMNVDDPQSEARDEATPAAMTRDRTRPISDAAADMQQDLPTVQRITRGGVDRRNERYNPDAELRSLPATTSERATLAKANSQTITRRDGPVPSDLPIDDIGADDPTMQASGTPGRTRLPSLERNRSPARRDGFDDPVRPIRTRTPAQSSVPSLTRSRNALDGFDIDRPRMIETPEFAKANTDAIKIDNKSRLPAEYQLRTTDGRLDAARKFGGNQQSEQAVDRSLKFLASTQEPAGYWSAAKYGAGQGDEATNTAQRPNVGLDADVGVTALAVLAYLGAGSTHERGTYRDNVDRALRWLIANQQQNGYLGGKDVDNIVGAYSHAIATFAIAEASAMREAGGGVADEAFGQRVRAIDPSARPDDWLTRPLKRAITYSLSAQLRDGGWRYEPYQPDGDTSIFGWHLMGLKSAELAGVQIPDRTREGMVSFLTSNALGRNGGLAGYRAGDRATPAMTAEALFCKQMLGLKRENSASREAVSFVMTHPPKLAEQNFYYWYYGTLSMYQYGGEPWRVWNERVRDLLVQEQNPDGSWAPRGPWGPYGGQIYSTAIATLCLEVYYRYLPLYKAGGRYRESQ